MSFISVIMSVYNDEEYLRSAIDSILNQSYMNFEFIIINDGSSDSSLEIIEELSRLDERILVVNRENKGLAYSLNEGIKIAKGKYIARMDADDISMPDRLEKQVKFIEQGDYDIIYGDTFLIDKDGADICPSYRPAEVSVVLKNLHINNFIPHPTVFAKRDVFYKYGFYNPNYKTGQDLELWLRFNNKAKFGYIPEVILKYRISPNSVRAKKHENYWFKVANKCVGNGHKKIALRYLSKLSVKEKSIVILKQVIPHRYFKRKLIL